MKRGTTLIAALLFVVLLLVTKSVGTARPATFASQKSETFLQNADVIFSKVKSDLASKTDVPLRLPSYFPDAGDVKNPIYANVQDANRKSYSIELGWAENCNGGNACHYGTVRGTSIPISENEGTRVPVKLRRGIVGYFIRFTCDAHCDDSTVGWTEGGYNYSISIKAADMKTLISVANSSFATRHDSNR